LDRSILSATQNVGMQEARNTQICLKIVVFDEEDYAYARYVAQRYPHFPLD
jgi:7-carboxy-7-deazaguanine synthase